MTLESANEDVLGLTSAEAEARLARFGPNALPEAKTPSLFAVFFRQFLSPLIYILVAAAVVSLLLGEIKDALFIAVVLVINGIIGTVQEYSANRAAAALRKLEQPHATVVRDGLVREISARDIVPGDLVRLDAGGRVPADLQLIEASDLHCDESLLTGESAPVSKSAVGAIEEGEAEQRRGQAFAGSTITRGRGEGIVTATGADTGIGKIAEQIGMQSASKPPLMIRMEAFTGNIAVAVGIAVVALVLVGLVRGLPFADMFMLSVALAVSAIPEGLPVAISVALAIGMRRMARNSVVVRKLPAAESLGSCTMIATDKTGTLTLNELTVTDITLPDGISLVCEAGHDLDACSIRSPHTTDEEAQARVTALLRAASLPNEAQLFKEEDRWKGIGDTVDVALLSVTRKGRMVPEDIRNDHPLVARIPYEPDRKYAASFHRGAEQVSVFVKGAPETLIAMADRMDTAEGPAPIDHAALLRQKLDLAARGLRVLAFAEGTIATEPENGYSHRHLTNLTFLGLAGMQDPVRPEVPAAIAACYDAGIEVAMVTGDDPTTASAIAREAGFRISDEHVVTGDQVREAEEDGEAALDVLTARARIYARVAPDQKLAIVLSMARNGHFVAVTGDGINDAPALRHAHVGVAMGLKGTDVAKESADIIITDDNFASIVSGILEGRVAYANIRKVIFMLVSTGVAEVVLFMLAIPFGLPMPLLPVQLLWLNLVTNGIQDVALAAEKAEGDELSYPPRRPSEPIFDRLMIRRILYSTLIMGVGGFLTFFALVNAGFSEAGARNMLLLLFVLFENVQTFNARSEHHSAFRQGFGANPLLVLSVIGAQAVHIAAMNIPFMRSVLDTAPVTPLEWVALLVIASTLLGAMEVEKRWHERHRHGSAAGARFRLSDLPFVGRLFAHR